MEIRELSDSTVCDVVAAYEEWAAQKEEEDKRVEAQVKARIEEAQRVIDRQRQAATETAQAEQLLRDAGMVPPAITPVSIPSSSSIFI